MVYKYKLWSSVKTERAKWAFFSFLVNLAQNGLLSNAKESVKQLKYILKYPANTTLNFEWCIRERKFIIYINANIFFIRLEETQLQELMQIILKFLKIERVILIWEYNFMSMYLYASWENIQGFFFSNSKLLRISDLELIQFIFHLFFLSLINCPLTCLWSLINCLDLQPLWSSHHNLTSLQRTTEFMYHCINQTGVNMRTLADVNLLFINRGMKTVRSCEI